MNTNESGRSMVEMLGVLAIIGVLSIGGIAGYTTAMNKYRANEVSQAVAMTVIQAKVKEVGEPASYSANIGEFPSSISGIVSSITATASSDESGSFVVTWNGDQTGVKKAFCVGSRDVGGFSATGVTCSGL